MKDLVPRFSMRKFGDFPFNSPRLSHSFSGFNVTSEDDPTFSRQYRIFSLPFGKDHKYSLEEKMMVLQNCLASPSTVFPLRCFSNLQGVPLDGSFGSPNQAKTKSSGRISLAGVPQPSYYWTAWHFQSRFYKFRETRLSFEQRWFAKILHNLLCGLL